MTLCETRVVHCQFHLLDHCGHMLNPLRGNVKKKTVYLKTLSI